MVLRRLSVHVRNVPPGVRPLNANADSPLARLRAATRARHERLDSSDWLSGATRDLPCYAEHIARAEALYIDAERALAPFAQALAAAGFAPHERRKAAILGAERAALRERGFAASAPAMVTFPVVADLSAVTGVLYVLEGSTLGGMLIARGLRERLGWESRFYGVYGERTAAMWRAFAQAVDGLGERLDDGAMIAAAHAMFDVYGARIAALAPFGEHAHA